MSFVELAGFLRRREDEVRDKARELRAHFRPPTPASTRVAEELSMGVKLHANDES
jgi:hypothetical protein